MEVPMLLWIDLCLHQTTTRLHPRAMVAEHFPLHRIQDVAGIPEAVDSLNPGILCFEYDYPFQTGLQALLKTKTRYPSLPIILLTEKHSVDLAIWALRTRVWDYFVKPVDPQALLRNLNLLSEAQNDEVADGHWHSLMPLHGIPKLIEARDKIRASEAKNTYPVLSYLRTHFSEPITLAKTAELFGMEPSQFSKKFKQEQGINFHEFLTQYRLGKALKLLTQVDINVTDVAIAVGFNDPSHFTRIFRRYVGVSPTQYRQRSQQH